MLCWPDDEMVEKQHASGSASSPSSPIGHAMLSPLLKGQADVWNVWGAGCPSMGVLESASISKSGSRSGYDESGDEFMAGESVLPAGTMFTRPK